MVFEEATFLRALNILAVREAAREADKDNSDAGAKEATPGKLTSEIEWEKCETMLSNQCSIFHGVLKVPLVYVIQEEEFSEENFVFETFTEKCFAKCPLSGPFFKPDARTIVPYTTGENSEVWVKRIKRHQNGRMDMEALRAHYRGKGNQGRRINYSETMKDTLHNKGESAMPFVTFLAKVQQLCNCLIRSVNLIRRQQNYVFFDKVQSPDLKHPVESSSNCREHEFRCFYFGCKSLIISGIRNIEGQQEKQ